MSHLALQSQPHCPCPQDEHLPVQAFLCLLSLERSLEGSHVIHGLLYYITKPSIQYLETVCISGRTRSGEWDGLFCFLSKGSQLLTVLLSVSRSHCPLVLQPFSISDKPSPHMCQGLSTQTYPVIHLGASVCSVVMEYT